MGVESKPADSGGLCADVCLVELGGVVGDTESAPAEKSKSTAAFPGQVYLEALQQLVFQVGPENFLVLHMGMLPLVGGTGSRRQSLATTRWISCMRSA